MSRSKLGLGQGLGQPGVEEAPNTEVGQNPLSRRSFLAGSAAILAGGALMAAPGVAKAHETEDPPSDIDILNFALTLEHLEATFYTQGLEIFGENEIEEDPIFRGFGTIRRRIYENLILIRDHEVEHVDTVSKLITLLGGTPVPPCTYNFEETAFTSVSQFIAVAQLLENTGVSAYDGANAHIQEGPVLTGGAQIATVEARHASYLNLINLRNGDEPDDGVPFPDAFDQPLSPRAVFDAASAFIVSCPEPYGPYPNVEEFAAVLPDFVVGLDEVIPIPPEGI